jgi:phosphopantothenoylcysteine decarboxylase/phosphopantothenate--cysteine ligase
VRIALGVGGGIAAYKAAELVRALQRDGHEVQVVLTEAAQEFITPLTFAALTGRKVITGLFPKEATGDATLSSAVEHIGVAQAHDVLVVAPATADLLAKFAHGLAPDFLTTLYLAFTGSVILAPAMNTHMWNHPATQENLSTLKRRGHAIVEPDSGWLACGTIGPGRLAEPEQIARAVADLSKRPRDLEGETVLITAGPTQEPLDPVRYISNRSSGKMGYALAEAAMARGAKVILVSGPVQLPAPAGAELVSVRTAEEMRTAVLDRLAQSTIVIKSAAVADYYLREIPADKAKKSGQSVTLTLEPTPDILAELGQIKGGRVLIGFAAETEHLVEQARRKLESKRCDMIVANLVGRPGTGFDSDENEVVLVTHSGQTAPVGPAPKREIADRILDEVPALKLALPVQR